MLGSKPGDARRVVEPSGASHRRVTTETSTREDHGVDVREIELSLRARPHATPKVTAPTRMDTNRLAKELREIQSDTKSGVTVEVLGDNLAHMQGTLKGASPSVHLPPFRPSRGTAVRIRARPRSDLSRASHPARIPVPHEAVHRRSHLRSIEPFIHRRTRGIPVRGRQVLRESPPRSPFAPQEPLLASAFSSTCFLNKSPHR